MGELNGAQILQWALLALSSFNTILPLWLGLTVLLNAERRAWGVWLAGGGLLAAGIFFIFHTALLAGSLYLLIPTQGLGRYAGWVAVILLPLAWYVAMLWFAGYWDRPDGPLRRSHRPPFIALCVAACGVAGLLPSSDLRLNRPNIDLESSLSIGGFPLLVILYPLYLLLCYLFSIGALRRLEPSGRVMGDLARVRARPWLVATSALQIGLTLLVTAALAWIALQRGGPVLTHEQVATLSWFDFGTSLLIAGSIYLLGEAIVSYEIFTGKILPRQGFRRHWRNALILAIGYSALLSLALTLELPPIYDLLVATVMVALFYALLNWRSYAERDRYLEHLRPFIGSQQLYKRFLDGATGEIAQQSGADPFAALCDDVLGARRACLIPLGAMAPLAGPPLAYPLKPPATFPWLADLVATLGSPRTLCVPLDPALYDDAVWGVPLWSERGLIGVLMLGEKLDGGLYTQEEMEIARASGERLIDIQAGVEMAKRLMGLQRRRLAESQVLDTRTRRVLHDDVLPQIHAAMLALGSEGAGSETIGMMGDLHRKISDLLRELPTPATQPVEKLGLLGALRGAVEGEFRNLFDDIQLNIEPEAEQVAEGISGLAADVCYYAAREAMRNAARYGRGGRPERPLHLAVDIGASGEGLAITIEDDGVGVDPNRASEGGSGQGLALHGTMMAVMGGSLGIESRPGAFTRVLLWLPAEQP